MRSSRKHLSRDPEQDESWDLSWQPNNPYKYSILETLVKISYDISKPVVALYCSITGTSPASALTYLSINLLGFARNYSRENIRLLYKQAVLETADFTSDMSIVDGNQFGMHLPTVRPTLASGFRWNDSENSNVAKFNSYFDSVLDRMLWDEYNDIPASDSNYQSLVIENDYNENPSTYAELWNNADEHPPYMAIIIFIAVLIFILLLIKKILF